MVVKKHILNNIKRLNRLYNGAPTPTDATYYSKLAIIELCGWVELSMDNIAVNFATRYLRTPPFIASFNDLLDKNYGFDYKRNFRKMMNQTIGLHNMEQIETTINATGDITVLDATLDALKILRNDAAHTFVGATTTYQAPSVTKNQLEIIYPILKKIGQAIRAL